MQDVKFDHIVTRVVDSAKLKEAAFERQKNWKAFLYAAIIVCALFIIFITISWKTPTPELPLKEDLVEVVLENVDLEPINLGNSETGNGDVQPLLKGQPAPLEEANTPPPPPQPNNESNEEPADPVVDDNNNDDAPAVNKPVNRPKNPSRNLNNNTPTVNKNPVVNNNPTPKPTPAPKPKGLFRSPNGSGGGGNGNETNNKDGFGKNGTGIQGDPSGVNGGRGTKLTNANLKNRGQIESLTNQSGTNYKGKVILTLNVDENGNATLSSISTTNASTGSNDAKSFARSIVSTMKFPSGVDNRTARIVLDFDY
jgi:hypothetical protein